MRKRFRVGDEKSCSLGGSYLQQDPTPKVIDENAECAYN